MSENRERISYHCSLASLEHWNTRMLLENLKQKRILVQRKRKKVKIDGFTDDDLTFLETACNGATYLLTRDRDFHDNKDKIRKARCMFEVLFPDRYVEQYEG